ncbi:hypothetical protein SPRG_00830 [Saprolegnia parasitica CBS 223.65]|uniref:Pyridoxamine 5'-phosphate oxidase Alr4036 family FMN-binding domain-containing protein n=1 Tax=Saprolegnia parasitica (strain CBS 223.65) TaxID=695850 RepID=A0A067CVQ7_SAPPC|nr:hypothetical protein SPRG_00830 [Saprolegnia parasitica CBS 223.65]KDO34769.1 hypothetical protein SPRG_00830 [Saprolegnia parasitica CBS 223.65]|eukprot:XP_012194436.1 hypothetical protein SPRG_00830 [Saprolegnia parasitica CBS 223.65]
MFCLHVTHAIRRRCRTMATSPSVSRLAPWKQRLQEAIEANRHIPGTHYLQMATVAQDGAPQCRTVVFRGFEGETGMTMITDARSAKVAQLQANPACEVAWWLPQNGEQFRIAGHVQLVTPDDDAAGLRAQLWHKLRESMRQQFFWPQPNTPFVDAPVPVVTSATPPLTFLVLVLRPQQVKYLRLHDSFAQVDTLNASDDPAWVSRRINP